MMSQDARIEEDTIIQNMQFNGALIQEISKILEWAEARIQSNLFGVGWANAQEPDMAIPQITNVRWEIGKQHDDLLKLREVAYRINNVSQKI